MDMRVRIAADDVDADVTHSSDTQTLIATKSMGQFCILQEFFILQDAPLVLLIPYI